MAFLAFADLAEEVLADGFLPKRPAALERDEDAPWEDNCREKEVCRGRGGGRRASGSRGG